LRNITKTAYTIIVEITATINAHNHLPVRQPNIINKKEKNAASAPINSKARISPATKEKFIKNVGNSIAVFPFNEPLASFALKILWNSRITLNNSETIEIN